MVLHNFIYRLKCIVRDKQMIFWTLLFPIILATLFNMAFSNLSKAENFSKIKIGIVNNTEFNNDVNFKSIITSVSNPDKSAGKSNLFDVKYTSKEEADKLLNDSKIEGYIYFDNGINLIVKKSGLNQTIIKSFLDDYKQSHSTVETLKSSNPSLSEYELSSSIATRVDYLKEVSISKSAPDTTVNYFYTLIAMACLYGSFWGLKEVTAIQADLSTQGARVNVAPTHKFKIFIASMLASTAVQLFEIFILLAYLTLVLKVSFGNQFGYIILTCIIGTITGVTFGTFIAAIVKKGEGVKVGILIGSTMLMSFLSGMMVDKIKYIVAANAPILGYLNPASLITDSFYSLYYYNTHTQYFTDLILLCAFSVVFSMITYLILRRQKYASL